MASSVFVGGFPYATTEEELARHFSACGKVVGVKILSERETGRPRGIGFVEMSNDAEARAAIEKLNGSMLGSREIFVNEARPREPRPGGSADRPGFVERRSGRDRRRPQGGGPGGSKEWGKKPGGGPGGDKKRGSWPASGEKRGGFGGKKKWGPGGPSPGRKPGGFKRKPGGFGWKRG